MHTTALWERAQAQRRAGASARVRFGLRAVARVARVARVAGIIVTQHDADEPKHQCRHQDHHRKAGDGEPDPKQHTGGVEQHAA